MTTSRRSSTAPKPTPIYVHSASLYSNLFFPIPGDGLLYKENFESRLLQCVDGSSKNTRNYQKLNFLESDPSENKEVFVTRLQELNHELESKSNRYRLFGIRYIQRAPNQQMSFKNEKGTTINVPADHIVLSLKKGKDYSVARAAADLSILEVYSTSPKLNLSDAEQVLSEEFTTSVRKAAIQAIFQIPELQDALATKSRASAFVDSVSNMFGSKKPQTAETAESDPSKRRSTFSVGNKILSPLGKAVVFNPNDLTALELTDFGLLAHTNGKLAAADSSPATVEEWDAQKESGTLGQSPAAAMSSGHSLDAAAALSAAVPPPPSGPAPAVPPVAAGSSEGSLDAAAALATVEPGPSTVLPEGTEAIPMYQETQKKYNESSNQAQKELNEAGVAGRFAALKAAAAAKAGELPGQAGSNANAKPPAPPAKKWTTVVTNPAAEGSSADAAVGYGQRSVPAGGDAKPQPPARPAVPPPPPAQSAPPPPPSAPPQNSIAAMQAKLGFLGNEGGAQPSAVTGSARADQGVDNGKEVAKNMKADQQQELDAVKSAGVATIAKGSGSKGLAAMLLAGQKVRAEAEKAASPSGPGK